MEDTLREVIENLIVRNHKVLILVLMEDTLRAFTVTGYVCRDAES